MGQHRKRVDRDTAWSRKRKRKKKKKRKRKKKEKQQVQLADNQPLVCLARERTIVIKKNEKRQLCDPSQLSTLLKLLLVTTLVAIEACTRASSLTDFDGATFYKAPVGSRVRIACNASHWSDDSISLVLWFKGGLGAGNQQPIYTIDARQRPLSSGQARHLVADAYRGRARFVVPPPAPVNNVQKSSNKTTSTVVASQVVQVVPYLDLFPLDANDQAEYRCRVDYRQRPREHFLAVLFVLVPPKSVQLIDSSGRLLNQIYGPLNEGAHLTLVCLARGGRPAPAIVWRAANNSKQQPLDETYMTLNDYLTLKRVVRNNKNNELAAADATQLKNQTLKIDWLHWPEFEFYENGAWWQQNAEKTDYASQDNVRSKTAATTTTKLGLFATTPPPLPLIELEADETLTTSVNVLQVNELTRQQLVELQPHGDSSAAAAANQSSRVPQLECRASNLHYDLRALIKMFAPPSLLMSSSSAASMLQQQALDDDADEKLVRLAVEKVVPLYSSLTSSSNGNNSGGEIDEMAFAKSVRLVQALDRALELNLNGANTSAGGGESTATATPTSAAEALASNPMAANNVSTDEHNDSDSDSDHNAAGWPHVIYQQLIRPHQLASWSWFLAPSTGNTNFVSQHKIGEQLARSQLIALDAYLRPLSVRILSIGSMRLAAGQVSEFECVSSGSRPAARISWLKNGQPLDAKLSRQADDNNIAAAADNQQQITSNDKFAPNATSRSKLALKLHRHDHLARLSCRAENEHLSKLSPGSKVNGDLAAAANYYLEDSITLDVHYIPQVNLELGNKMLSEHIRESKDIFFVCQVDAQPTVKEITWLHNERPLNESLVRSSSSDNNAELMQNNNNNNNNVIISNQTLVLQRVRIQQRGKYACLAANSEGVGVSNSIELRVLHAPICVALQSGEKTTKGNNNKLFAIDEVNMFALNEPLMLSTHHLSSKLRPTIRLSCSMLAEPAEQVEFVWYVNNSLNERRVLPSTSNNITMKLVQLSSIANISASSWSQNAHVAISYLDYKIVDDNETNSDFGLVYCVAKNSIGDSQRACVHSIERPSGEWDNEFKTTNDDSMQTPPLDTATNNDSDYISQQYASGESAHSTPIACLPVNVTEQSAWIGCELLAMGLNQQDGEKEQSSNIDNIKFRYEFNVLVFSHSSHGDQNDEIVVLDEPSNQMNTKRRQLVANLTSQLLDEPLFAVVNLRPATKYELAITSLLDSSPLVWRKRQQRSHTIVHLETTPQLTSTNTKVQQQPTPQVVAHNNNSDTAEVAAAAQRPTIRRVTEPHRADLVAAALISTRSTATGHAHNQSSTGRLLQKYQTSTSSDSGGGSLASISSTAAAWATLGSLVDALLGGGGGGSRTSDVKRQIVGVGRTRTPTSGGNVLFMHSMLADTNLMALCVIVLFLVLVSLLLIIKRSLRRNNASAQLDTKRRRRKASTLNDDDDDDALKMSVAKEECGGHQINENGCANRFEHALELSAHVADDDILLARNVHALLTSNSSQSAANNAANNHQQQNDETNNLMIYASDNSFDPQQQQHDNKQLGFGFNYSTLDNSQLRSLAAAAANKSTINFMQASSLRPPKAALADTKQRQRRTSHRRRCSSSNLSAESACGVLFATTTPPQEKQWHDELDQQRLQVAAPRQLFGTGQVSSSSPPAMPNNNEVVVSTQQAHRMRKSLISDANELLAFDALSCRCKSPVSFVVPYAQPTNDCHAANTIQHQTTTTTTSECTKPTLNRCNCKENILRTRTDAKVPTTRHCIQLDATATGHRHHLSSSLMSDASSETQSNALLSSLNNTTIASTSHQLQWPTNTRRLDDLCDFVELLPATSGTVTGTNTANTSLEYATLHQATSVVSHTVGHQDSSGSMLLVSPPLSATLTNNTTNSNAESDLLVFQVYSGSADGNKTANDNNHNLASCAQHYTSSEPHQLVLTTTEHNMLSKDCRLPSSDSTTRLQSILKQCSTKETTTNGMTHQQGDEIVFANIEFQENNHDNLQTNL